jgi:SAM-dependent methyltransferase
MLATTSPPATCPGCGARLDGRVLLRGHDRLMGGPGDFAVVACAACGLASTQPRPRPEQFADYYPEAYYRAEGAKSSTQAGGRGLTTAGDSTTERGDSGGRLSRLVEQGRLEAIVRFGPYRQLSRRKPGRMLDVGCGGGELALTFRRHGWVLAGVEPSSVAAARARAGGVEVHSGTLDDAPWRGPTFDAIVFNHSLEHVPDPTASLRQAAGLLREEGMLAVAVPNFGCWQRRLFGSRWFQLDLPRHLQHLETETLAALLRRAGLRPVGHATASMRPGLLISLQYLAFGRARWTGRGLRLAAWAIAPLLWVLDRFAAGDCLHMFAVRERVISR